MLARRPFLLSLLGVPVLAFADLYDDYLNSTSKQPFVSFLGRKGTTSTIGHSFVGVGVQIDSGLRVYERLFGLYPKDGALAGLKSVFTKASGKLDASWDDLAWDTELRRTINEDMKQQVLAKFALWSADAPAYSLTANGGINCNGLIVDVASGAGLKIPDGAGSTRPWKFIELLKQINSGQ